MTSTKPTIVDGSGKSVSSDEEGLLHPEGDGAVSGLASASGGMVETRSDTLSLLEEVLSISKREVVTGTVRVSTRTEVHDEVAEVTVDRNVVDVTRVAVGRVVDVAPTVRTEGGVTIVPVLEERFVVVKQLVLKEELHIRHRVETDVERVPIQLRRQRAVVERVGRDGRAVVETVPDADPIDRATTGTVHHGAG